jgi:hypothetical protein
VGFIYADFRNGGEKAYYFFSAVRELMKQDRDNKDTPPRRY